MSSPSDWLRSDCSSRSRGIGALLPTHLLATTRYGHKRSAVDTRGGFTVWRPLTTCHILQALCLELGLLGPIQRTFVIRSMHWMNWCKGSSRGPTRGTQSCMRAMRGIRSSGHNRYSLWSRGWWPCIATSSRCGVEVYHLVYSLHYLDNLHPHLHRLSLLHTTHTSEEDNGISDTNYDQYS